MRCDPRDEELKLLLRDLPREHRNRYSDEAARKLLQILFYNLSDGNPTLLPYFFPDGPPANSTDSKPWKLAEAQGGVDGAEYTESARGKPCGHVFREGEATYQCKTCAVDETCVLCARCFEASDHEGHQMTVTHSEGRNGCCDCGDPEAWTRPLNCSIHSSPSSNTSNGGEQYAVPGKSLPERLRRSIPITISRALDYICDVFSCSPEQMRTPKSEDIIRENEVKSRLSSWYGATLEPENDNEFALVLWNDEKHTLEEVQEQLARALRQPRSKAKEHAREVDVVGRSIVAYSTSVADLIAKAKVLAHIKVTVTIRSARDTFREQMCETIIEWLSDIAGCSVGNDNHFLMHVICEELLNKWRIGSTAFNLGIAQGGLVDNQQFDDRLHQMNALRVRNRMMLFQRVAAQRMPGADQTPIPQDEQDARDAATSDGDNADEDDDDDEEEDEEEDEDEGAIAEGEDDDEMEIDEAFLVVPAELAPIDDPDREDRNVMMAIRAQARPDSPTGSSEDRDGIDVRLPAQTDPNTLFSQIPSTPKRKHTERPQAPGHWLSPPVTLLNQASKESQPLWEDMHERVRVDHLVFYDMRMWKNLRDSLRQFYIATVVTVPSFKRILSLRFAALYTHLSQLFLLADREADHSIIHLSLQMLTAPSITEEVVKRSNFYTRILAILYTFLTKRQVGGPEDVDPQAAISFEQNTVTNRRIYHVFTDMRYLLESKFVQECVRTKPEYLLQFLDFAKLFQGICPNRRAVVQHVEYESDAWLSASILVRDITRITRQVCDCFQWSRDQDPGDICRAIRQAAKIATINSLGVESERFKEGEMVKPVAFKTLPIFQYEELLADSDPSNHVVVDCVVDKTLMSFHHALHYTLSWLINSGKSMTRDQLQGLLKHSHHQLQSQEARSGSKIRIPEHEPQQYLLALFDIPLRLCAWIAQMRSGMWVRNGITLRHQLTTYRGVTQRDVSYQRDIFLLQTAFVVCPPATFLASVIDRFGMTEWMTGNFIIKAGHEDTQMLDVAEDFLHLLIVILCDRTLLQPPEEEHRPKVAIILRDLIHVLCFKPLTFSKLAEKMSDKIVESKEFQQVLVEVATFRPPEGLADSGTWRLKDEYFLQVDPYYTHYSKSQREEAETLYRTHKSKFSGQPMDQVYFEPQLRPIHSGVFQDLAHFTQTPLFSQIIHCMLKQVIEEDIFTPHISVERVEAFLHVVLHLALIAVLEDKSSNLEGSFNPKTSFLASVFELAVATKETSSHTILSQLFMLLENEKLRVIRPRIRLLLMRIRQAQPERFDKLFETGDLSKVRATLLNTSGPDDSADQSLKKKQAQARQARVMASFKKQQDEFMESQTIDWGVESLSDSDEDMDFVDQTSERKFWDVPSGTCILCQAETSEKQLYGTLGYITESRLFRQTNLQDADFVKEVFASSSSLDRSADAIRPFGVAGENIDWISKTGADGNQIVVERKSLGKGFPTTHLRSGPMMTGCGHIMHLSCFYEYVTATERRHSYQYTRNHPEKVSRKEFICPLCKALGNAFMPVIWKPRERFEPSAPEDGAFDSWLGSLTQLPSINNLSQDVFRNYAAQNLVPSFLSERTYIVNQEQIARTLATASERRPTVVKTSSSAELGQAYKRLRDTLKSNSLPTRFGHDAAVPDYLSMTDTLADAIGFSITAVEIAQRGAESQAPIFVDSVPNQSIAQLRVLSETVTAFLTMGALHTRDRTLGEIHECSRSQYEMLLSPHRNENRPNAYVNAPLLSKDSFVFAAACSVFLVPVFDIPIHHVLRLCCLAETIKVVVAVLRDPSVVRDASSAAAFGNLECTSEQGQNFSSFVQSIIYQYQSDTPETATTAALEVDENPNSRFRFDQHIRKMISSYTLPFLRKCALLMHVRYGVDYSGQWSVIDPDTCELARLCRVLQVPSTDELVASYISNDATGDNLRRLGASWISDWKFCSLQINRAFQNNSNISRSMVTWQMREDMPIKLPHPGIYELVALPHTHDTLNSIAMSRRCPTTGRELNDPCVCLFCGSVFCGQATCCSKADGEGDSNNERIEGGCYRHQQRCGGNVGMFLNIRKCAVLFLNRDNGSWFTPPYLDRHGEVDIGLKRRQQLFLHQTRYDRLFRDVWLGFGGGIPSAVARRLEAEINTGGWETM